MAEPVSEPAKTNGDAILEYLKERDVRPENPIILIVDDSQVSITAAAAMCRKIPDFRTRKYQLVVADSLFSGSVNPDEQGSNTPQWSPGAVNLLLHPGLNIAAVITDNNFKEKSTSRDTRSTPRETQGAEPEQIREGAAGIMLLRLMRSGDLRIQSEKTRASMGALMDEARQRAGDKWDALVERNKNLPVIWNSASFTVEKELSLTEAEKGGFADLSDIPEKGLNLRAISPSPISKKTRALCKSSMTHFKDMADFLKEQFPREPASKRLELSQRHKDVLPADVRPSRELEFTLAMHDRRADIVKDLVEEETSLKERDPAAYDAYPEKISPQRIARAIVEFVDAPDNETNRTAVLSALRLPQSGMRNEHAYFNPAPGHAGASGEEEMCHPVHKIVEDILQQPQKEIPRRLWVLEELLKSQRDMSIPADTLELAKAMPEVHVLLDEYLKGGENRLSPLSGRLRKSEYESQYGAQRAATFGAEIPKALVRGEASPAKSDPDVKSPAK